MARNRSEACLAKAILVSREHRGTDAIGVVLTSESLI